LIDSLSKRALLRSTMTTALPASLNWFASSPPNRPQPTMTMCKFGAITRACLSAPGSLTQVVHSASHGSIAADFADWRESTHRQERQERRITDHRGAEDTERNQRKAAQDSANAANSASSFLQFVHQSSVDSPEEDD
jgi:hypothetical protein